MKRKMGGGRLAEAAKARSSSSSKNRVKTNTRACCLCLWVVFMVVVVLLVVMILSTFLAPMSFLAASSRSLASANTTRRQSRQESPSWFTQYSPLRPHPASPPHHYVHSRRRGACVCPERVVRVPQRQEQGTLEHRTSEIVIGRSKQKAASKQSIQTLETMEEEPSKYIKLIRYVVLSSW